MGPVSMNSSMSTDSVEQHRTSVPESFVPETAQYRGGGIFADVTGPAQKKAARNHDPMPERRGLDFAPSPIPMAAPYMPDIGAPPTDGIFGRSAGVGLIEHEQAHTLGFSFLAVAVGAVAGVKYGGMYGGIAGSLFAGAIVNAYRAFSYYKEGNEASDSEAKVSGTYAVAAAVAGAVMWTKLASKSTAYQRNFDVDEDDEDEDDEQTVTTNPTGCDIRPVGP